MRWKMVKRTKKAAVTGQQHQTLKAWFVDESPLYFSGNNKDYDQKRGLVMHGPAEWNEVGNQGYFQLRIGVVGTGDGIHAVNEACAKLMSKVSNSNKSPIKAPPFPGM